MTTGTTGAATAVPRCVRAFVSGWTRAHLLPLGGQRALCGVQPRRDARWVTNGKPARRLADLKPCARCAALERFLQQVAAWDAPPPKPGAAAMVPYATWRAKAGECARCERLRRLPYRGLCLSCIKAATQDGTIGDYGWVREDRLGEYAALRSGGLTVGEAAKRAGVSARTGHRYEKALAEAGRAPWRAAA